MVGSFAGCCARAASGHTVAAAPPRIAMTSRRLISNMRFTPSQKQPQSLCGSIARTLSLSPSGHQLGRT
jgi:hypothetical protein